MGTGPRQENESFIGEWMPVEARSHPNALFHRVPDEDRHQPGIEDRATNRADPRQRAGSAEDAPVTPAKAR
ncbi:MAG: hypothetical protein ACREDV_04390 [Methylocella sp.]